jgi:hypothetical protein
MESSSLSVQMAPADTTVGRTKWLLLKLPEEFVSLLEILRGQTKPLQANPRYSYA